MKLSKIKKLIREMVSEVLSEDTSGADDQIKKVKKTIASKMDSDKQLTEPESQIAIDDADPDMKKKLASSIKKGINTK